MPLLYGFRSTMSQIKDIERIIRAASERQLDTVRRFIDGGIGVDAEDRHGNRAINLAAKNGHLDVVQFLVGRGAQLNKPDGMGRTPLLAAAEGDHDRIIDYLVSVGADINGRGEAGRTALMEASNLDSVAAARRLLELGADVNAKTETGATALHEAAYRACEEYAEPNENEMIPLLLGAGGDAHARDTEGVTPLDLAGQYADEIDYGPVLRGSE